MAHNPLVILLICVICLQKVYVQVVAGNSFTCGIAVDQTLQCWGDKSFGDLSGLYSQITAGDIGMCGIMIDGVINCWGGTSLIHFTLRPEYPFTNQ
jgi:hypothetical protein